MRETGQMNYQSCLVRKRKIRRENEILQKLNSQFQMKTLLFNDSRNLFDSTFANTSKLTNNNSQTRFLSQTYYSVLDNSPNKLQRDALESRLRVSSSAQKIRIKKAEIRKRHRVESLEKIINKCTQAREELGSSRKLTSSRKSLHESVRNLTSSIEKCKNDYVLINSNLHSEKLLRLDSKVLRNQLSFTEKLRKKAKGIWRFPTTGMRKKTDKLLTAVSTRLKIAKA